MLKNLFNFTLFICGFCLLHEFCDMQTDGFSVARVSSSLSYHPEWDTVKDTVRNTPLAPEALRSVLDQPFSYLGCGGQCYVFLSADGTHVIKFFKHHRYNLASLFKRNRQQEKRWKKLQRDFNSYKLAFEKLQEETGVVYVHLNKTSGLNVSTTIIDKLGIAHELPLDQYEFIVQKRADLVYPAIATWMGANRLGDAKEALDSLVRTLHARCQKGIYDEDAKIHRNAGFIGTRALLIDAGRFVEDPLPVSLERSKFETRKITRRLNQWLIDNRYLELSAHLEETIEAL